MQVHDRPAEVRLERIGLAHVPEPTDASHERFLREVLCVHPIAREQERESYTGADVARVQLLEPRVGDLVDFARPVFDAHRYPFRHVTDRDAQPCPKVSPCAQENPPPHAADLRIRVPSPGSGIHLPTNRRAPTFAMETKLTAERRSDAGKGVARKLRAAGKIPAVLYGQGLETTPLTVEARELTHLLHGSAGSNVLVDLVVDGEEHLAIPREIQRDHIHAKFVHVDFLAVSRTQTITVNVPVHETGEAAGVKEGGVVEHHLREVQIECLPQDVPDEIVIDITHVELGEMVHVSDLVAPKGVTILTTLEDAVLSVVTPAALRVEADLSVPGEEAVEVPAEDEAAEVAEGEEAEGAEGEGQGDGGPGDGESGSESGEGGEG